MYMALYVNKMRILENKIQNRISHTYTFQTKCHITEKLRITVPIIGEKGKKQIEKGGFLYVSIRTDKLFLAKNY